MILRDDLSEEDLAKLAKNATDEQKRAVAKHPNTSLETLLLLSQDGFFEEVDQNPLLPLHIEVGSEDAVSILVSIADQTNRAERLTELASSIWNYVRSEVAMNTSTPPDVLELLAKDSNDTVRRGVAMNYVTPSDILFSLAHDEDWYVRFRVSENTNTPPNILVILAKDSNISVRLGVSKNLHTPPDTLAMLAKDVEKYVRLGVAENVNTPPDALSHLTKDAYAGKEAKATLANIKRTKR
jgi:hypothetical protein